MTKVLQITTDIVLVDVVGFSLLSDAQQYGCVAALTGSLQMICQLLASQGFRHTDEVFLGFIPTGDGFYIILNPALTGYGPFLAFSVRSTFLQANKRGGLGIAGIRCAIHNGVAMPFKDVNGVTNFVGTGLNACARLLPSDKPTRDTLTAFATDDNFIVASDSAMTAFDKAYPRAAAPDWFQAIKWRCGNVFTITDKHGITYSVCPIEASRYMAVKPPLPADWLARSNTPPPPPESGAA